MSIKVGSILTLLAPVGVWVIAAAVANDAGCRSIESSLAMSESVKVFMKIFLLCGVV